MWSHTSMKLIFIPIICLFSLPVSAADLVGLIVPPYPSGLSSDMGSCIANKNDFCAYSIASLNGADKTVAAIAAMQLVKYINDNPVWRIIDVHSAPKATKGQIWAFEECSLNGNIDPTVVGLVTFKDKGGWIEADKTLWAIKFDPTIKKLATPNLKQVECALP